jgi:type VI secretion system secreted protein VgrG
MTPSFVKVAIDGTDVMQNASFLILLDVSITHELNRHPECRIRYRQPPSSRFFYEPMIGKDLTLKAVSDQGAELILFDGILRQADAEWESSFASVITFSGIGASYALDTFNRSQTFTRLTLEEVVDRLLGDKLGDFISTEPGPTSAIQYDESNWSFLYRVLDRFGTFLRVNGRKIDVIDNFQPPVVELPWRTESGLQMFRTSAKITPSTVFGVNFDFSEATSKQLKDVKEKVDSLDTALEDLRSGAMQGTLSTDLTSGFWNRFLAHTHELFEKELKVESKRQIVHSCTAYGESRTPEIKVGNQVQVTGMDDVNGTYGVFKLTHSWEPGAGYRNHFHCTPFIAYLDRERPRCERFYGPVFARVAEIGRAEIRNASVRVNFLWEDNQESDWIPIVSNDAGADRGICFIPEVGDQVMVFFQGGDSSKPFITGSLWNGVDQAPLEDLHGGEYPKNDIKRIVTKSGNRLVFDDKQGSETLVMAGPNHVRVSLFDGGSTLLLHSDGNINIHAGGTVHMRCKQFIREVG